MALQDSPPAVTDLIEWPLPIASVSADSVLARALRRIEGERGTQPAAFSNFAPNPPDDTDTDTGPDHSPR